MPKIVIDDIGTQFGFKAAINEKLNQIESEFNNKVLYRDNPVGEPNAMSSDLDMGGNDILNINKITVNDIGVVGESSFQELIVEAKNAATTSEEQATLAGLYKDAAQYAAGQAQQSVLDAKAEADRASVEANRSNNEANRSQGEADRAQGIIDSAQGLFDRVDEVETEVEKFATMLIGSIVPSFCSSSYIPSGCVPADGAEYTRTQFPDFYDTYLVTGKLLTTTYTSFTSQIALTGNCAKFALDTTNQKFKVPLLKDGDSLTHATSSAEIGKSYKAGLPDIQATAGSVEFLSKDATGAFYNVGNTPDSTFGSNGTKTFAKLGLKASLYNSIYGNSSTVTDEQVRLRYFVVIASIQNNASVFDWSNYMAGLAGKANLDMDNLSQAGTTAISHYVKPSNRRVNMAIPSVSGGTIQMPGDGTLQIMFYGGNAFVSLTNNTTFVQAAATTTFNSAGNQTSLILPVSKDDIVSVWWSGTSLAITSLTFNFDRGAY